MALRGRKGRGDRQPSVTPHPGLELPEGYENLNPAGRQNNHRRKKRNNTDSQQDSQQNKPTGVAYNTLGHHQYTSLITFLGTFHQLDASKDDIMRQTLLSVWKEKKKLSDDAFETIDQLTGPVRFIEEPGPMCGIDPTIGFNKERYDRAREEKYQPEPLISMKNAVIVPARLEKTKQLAKLKLDSQPYTYADEFPNGHSPAKNQEEARKIYKYFPHMEIKTRAPLSGWGENHSLSFSSNPDINAPTTPLLRVLRNVELGQKILEGLAGNYDDMASLSATCVTAFRLIDEQLTDRWNMTLGMFNMCEQTINEIKDTTEDKEALADKLKYRGVSKFLIVSPTHDVLDPERAHKWRRAPNAHNEVVNTMKFFRSLYNVGDSIRNMQLHRMPLLDTVLVRAMLPMLPNLETLGVLQCPLIAFYDSEEMLRIIQAHQEKHGPLKLDFSPRFHHGCPNAGRNGSFGLFYSDAGRPIKTALGARLIFRILPLAWEAGQHHWFELSSTYSRFLERLPLPDYFVPRVLHVALTAAKCKDQLVEHNSAYIKHMFNMAGAVLGDGAFLTGEAFIHESQLVGGGYPVWSEMMQCERCKRDMPNYLFCMGTVCDSCSLVVRIINGDSHFKQDRIKVAAALYTDCGMKVGTELQDLRDNFDFAQPAFLDPSRLQNFKLTVTAAMNHAAQVELLRVGGTKLIRRLERGELHTLRATTEGLVKATYDRDWNPREKVAVLNHGFNDIRYKDPRYKKAEDWDEMRWTREKRRQKLDVFCKHYKHPMDPETQRQIIRLVPCKKWFRDPVTGKNLDIEY